MAVGLLWAIPDASSVAALAQCCHGKAQECSLSSILIFCRYSLCISISKLNELTFASVSCTELYLPPALQSSGCSPEQPAGIWMCGQGSAGA